MTQTHAKDLTPGDLLVVRLGNVRQMNGLVWADVLDPTGEPSGSDLVFEPDDLVTLIGAAESKEAVK